MRADVRYGSHSTAALQGSLGAGSASLVSLVSRWVGPGAAQDVEGIANDLAALKEQIGPLPKSGGLGGVAKWLAQLAEAHGKNLEAIVEAAKTDVEDLLHKPAVQVATPPPTTGAPITMPAFEPSVTPVPASQSQAEPSQGDAVAELATLVPPA